MIAGTAVVIDAEVRGNSAKSFAPSRPATPAENIQAAQARIAARNGNAAYGTGMGGASQTAQRGEMTASPYSPPIVVIEY
jgi:hypothetical protein